MHKLACASPDPAMLVAVRSGNAQARFLPRTLKHNLFNTHYP